MIWLKVKKAEENVIFTVIFCDVMFFFLMRHLLGWFICCFEFEAKSECHYCTVLFLTHWRAIRWKPQKTVYSFVWRWLFICFLCDCKIGLLCNLNSCSRKRLHQGLDFCAGPCRVRCVSSSSDDWWPAAFVKWSGQRAFHQLFASCEMCATSQNS